MAHQSLMFLLALLSWCIAFFSHPDISFMNAPIWQHQTSDLSKLSAKQINRKSSLRTTLYMWTLAERKPACFNWDLKLSQCKIIHETACKFMSVAMRVCVYVCGLCWQVGKTNVAAWNCVTQRRMLNCLSAIKNQTV